MTRSLATPRAGATILLAAAWLGAAPAMAQTTAQPTDPAASAAEASAPAAPLETLATYDAATVLARLGDETVTLGDLLAARRSLPPQVQTLPDDRLYAGLLDQLTRDLVFARSARDLALDADPLVAARIAAATRSILAQSYAERDIAPGVTEEQVRARYEEELAKVEAPVEIRARHILVATEAEAQAAKARIDAGEAFETVASELSTDSSREQGGDLGFFGRGMMVPPFEEAAFALEPGQVSAPVASDFGWHVIKVEERRTTPPPPFEQVADRLRDLMVEEAMAARLDALSAQLGLDRPQPQPPVSAIRQDNLLGAN